MCFGKNFIKQKWQGAPDLVGASFLAPNLDLEGPGTPSGQCLAISTVI